MENNGNIAFFCGDPGALLNSLKQAYQLGPSMPSPYTEGTVIDIFCMSGFVWSAGAQIRQITCNISGWTPSNPPCTRMIELFKKFL